MMHWSPTIAVAPLVSARPTRIENDQFDELLSRITSEVNAAARRLIRETVGGGGDSQVVELLWRAFSDDTPSEYAFVFRHSHNLCKPPNAVSRTIEAAIHVLQRSTFVADDIIDRSTRRDHRLTIAASEGVDRAVVAGALLQSIGLNAIALQVQRMRFRNRAKLVPLMTRTLVDLYLGQHDDLARTGRADTRVGHYMRMISRTTGRFVAAVARAGAILGECSLPQAQALERFGHHYGLALQIADDIVDISDSPDETGKSFAPDLRGRRMRLPVILGLKLGNARVRRTLEQLLSSRTVNGTQASAARVAIIESGALTASAAAAKRHARAALASLDSFGDAFSIRALRALASTLLPAQGIGP